MRFLADILFILFPGRCDVCGRLLSETEKILCSYCLLELPRTNFHSDPANQVSMLFWGRVDISDASAWFYFQKGSPYQVLLHKLKYQGRNDIGIRLGRYYGAELIMSVFSKAEMIIPVPLHPLKKKKRGYNQSEMIAKGLSESLGIQMYTDVLVRSIFTETQTRKNRFERFLNMDGKFIVKDPEVIHGRSVILVDDVVTTGSTIEACAAELLKNGCGEIKILVLAVA